MPTVRHDGVPMPEFDGPVTPPQRDHRERRAYREPTWRSPRRLVSPRRMAGARRRLRFPDYHYDRIEDFSISPRGSITRDRLNRSDGPMRAQAHTSTPLHERTFTDPRLNRTTRLSSFQPRRLDF